MFTKILDTFIKHKLIVNILVLTIILVGIFSVTKIKQDVFPPTDMQTMFIKVLYPGASASDVEINAVIPIELALKQINGIKEYTSLSLENGATLYVFIDPDSSDIQAVKDDIYRNINTSALKDISKEVEQITIIDANPKLMPIVTLGISANNQKETSEADLYKLADKLESQLLRIKGVAEIRKTGYREQEIHINVHPKKMQQYYVSLNDVVTSIQNRNIRSTGGSLQSLQKEQTIVTIGQFQDPLDVGNVIIRSSFEKKRVYIKDLASIKKSFKKSSTLVKVNKKPAVVFQIVKKEKADIVDTVKNVQAFLNKNQESFNEKFKVNVLEDKSKSISALLHVVISNALIGFVLVLIILVIFLDFKTAFWTAFGLPLTLLMVFIYMYLAGLSLNVMTLGAIIMVLGMIVDDAIVISESIFEERKNNTIDAALIGLKRVIAPVCITSITTIIAFLPMLAVKGIMGKFIWVFPIIVSVALIASLLESIFMLPNHLSNTKQVIKAKKDWFKPFADWYEKTLLKVLRFRYIVIIGFIAIFIGALFVSQNSIKNFVLLWDDSADAIFVNLEAPNGTSLKKTEFLTKAIETKLTKLISPTERISIITNIGHHTVKRSNSKGEHENWAQLLIHLVPKTQRDRSAAQIIQDLRKKINPKKINTFKRIGYKERVIGPAPGEAIDIKIINKNFDKSLAVQKKLDAFISTIKGIKNLDNDQKGKKEELTIKFNYEKLAQLGLTVAQVAQTVRIAYEGLEATSIQQTNHKLGFRVKIADNFSRDELFLENLLIPNKTGRLIKLKEVAKIIPGFGKSIINHYNGDKIITITASVNPGVITASKATKQINTYFKNKISPNYPGTYLKLGGEAKETKDTLGDLAIVFGMALIGIYFILILLFNSLTQPLLILFIVPMGTIGGLLAFQAHQMPLSFMGIIGLIGLSGIIVNDGVVMINFINSIRNKTTNLDTKTLYHIIAAGAKQRLRPVILTTLTTVAALMPTVYGLGGDVKSLVPVVMAIAYGLIFATFLTLLLLPCLYLIHLDIVKVFSRKKY
ncbi:efflux RND transporter permease subunit [bacterium]|nr:efflux RND transporter permease subunit [bacterium]